MKKKALII